MLKDKQLREVFPPSHLNENATIEDICIKADEEIEEVYKALIEENMEEAAQECLDAARMFIELFRRCCKNAETEEHHQICNHIRKLQKRGTIDV